MKSLSTVNDADTLPPPVTLKPVWRVVISALLAVHLVALVAGPWSFAPLHSDLADTCYRALQPYVEGLGLNNGYRFFAPEPGPSHLIRYEIETVDGERIEGVFPDLTTQWPRLRYHRHFMLTEFLNSLRRPEPPPEVKQLEEAYAESYARHLVSVCHARKVNLFIRRHRLPSMADVRGGMKLSDPSLYDEQVLGNFEPDEE